MIMHEYDPDVVQWGLHLLHVDPFPNSGYCGTTTENDTCFYDREYAIQGNFGTDRTTIENDEIIAHALQEEFSQLAVAEESGLSHANEEHVQTSVLRQDWYGSAMRNLCSGNEGEQEHGDDMGPSSCSSPEVLYEGQERLLVLADDFSTLDVGKRLHHVAPTPHKPRINREIPSADEATSDHQRLLERIWERRSIDGNFNSARKYLQKQIWCLKDLHVGGDIYGLYELVERKVQGDGNCQFRALSDQFYRTPEHHKFVRQQVIDQLKSHPEIYEGYVPMAYDEYLKKMSSTGEWGDHVTLQAAADSYGVKIFVITSFKDTCYIEIQPSVQKSKRVIFLSFWAEVHYNSIYPDEELPESEPKKKKRWWHFGNRL